MIKKEIIKFLNVQLLIIKKIIMKILKFYKKEKQFLKDVEKQVLL